MTILQDSSGGKWRLGIDIFGRLTTTLVSSGAVTILHITDIANQTWLIGVTTGGLLTTTSIAFDIWARTFLLLPVPIGSGGNVGAVLVGTDGRLQTQVNGVTLWIQNGLGAGTDNSVAGGGGGFMALPQPPTPSGNFNPSGKGGGFDLGNSWNGEFGSVVQTVTTGGTFSVINNPGRSA